MVDVSYRRWVLSVDPALTREAYVATPRPDWSACCDTCENFAIAVAKNGVLPGEILDLFEKLGIDAEKAAEQFEWTEARSGWHTYSAWYHVIGELVSGPDYKVLRPEGGIEVVLEPVTKDFRLGFSHKTDLVMEQFAAHPLVQVEFSAELPWLLSRPPYHRVPGQP